MSTSCYFDTAEGWPTQFKVSICSTRVEKVRGLQRNIFCRINNKKIFLELPEGLIEINRT
jgi:hypothetical protein